VVIRDGAATVTVTYGDDGRWIETFRDPDDAMAGVQAVVARGGGRPVELVADYVAALDPGRHSPGRVRLAVPLPAVTGRWWHGLHAIREALFDDAIPSDARWAVADGYAGTALAWGATREDALAAWRGVVDHVRPRPATSEIPPDFPPESVVSCEVSDGVWSAEAFLRGQRSDMAEPEPTPANTPAVLVPLAPAPPRPPPRGRWVRLLGDRGTTVHAVYLRDAAGFTLVGEKLLEILSLDGLGRRLDAVPSHPEPDLPWHPDRPPRNYSLVSYRFVDDRTLVPIEPRIAETSHGAEFRARQLDGDRVRWQVVRMRRLATPS